MSKEDPEIPLNAYQFATYVINTYFTDLKNTSAITNGQVELMR